MFSITENKGFQITFENGYTISCQFGTGSYCDRRSFTEPYGSELGMRRVESANCEVAIWRDNGDFITGAICDAADVDVDGDGMVAGYVSPEAVAKLIAYISTL